jgi:hypothetical protein
MQIIKKLNLLSIEFLLKVKKFLSISGNVFKFEKFLSPSLIIYNIEEKGKILGRVSEVINLKIKDVDLI